MIFLDPYITSCYVFDKNKGTVLGVTQNEIKNTGTEVKLQTPKRHNARQKWELVLDDANPEWLMIKNVASGLYLQDYSDDEIVVNGKYL